MQLYSRLWRHAEEPELEASRAGGNGREAPAPAQKPANDDEWHCHGGAGRWIQWSGGGFCEGGDALWVFVIVEIAAGRAPGVSTAVHPLEDAVGKTWKRDLAWVMVIPDHTGMELTMGLP